MRVRLAVAAIGLVCAAAASANDVIVGVLEEVPSSYAAQRTSKQVRVVFRRDKDGWSTFANNCDDQACLQAAAKTFPPQLSWWVAFRGKLLGQLRSTAPETFDFYSHIGLQAIPPGQTIPEYGNPSVDFGGYTDSVVHRPLVAVTAPSFNDPDEWKPAPHTGPALETLRKAFLARYPRLCRNNAAQTKLEAYDYKDSDVTILKAYASSSRGTIALLHLADAVECDNTEAGTVMDDPWFLLRPDGSSKYIDRGMFLVDAGDYDGDGHSELVFSISRYNRGGYELFYDGFERRAMFEYGYQ